MANCLDDTYTIVEIVPDESKLIYAINIFMPPTSKKLMGHIGFGLSAQFGQSSLSA